MTSKRKCEPQTINKLENKLYQPPTSDQLKESTQIKKKYN